MRVIIQKDYDKCAKWAANYIANKIKVARPTAAKPFVLGLPTGSTPMGVYKELVNMFKSGKLSFQHVVTFSMDEYIGLDLDHPQSYAHFMFENLYNHIDIKKENINILNGMTKDYAKECATYESKMRHYGGVNLFFGGIGTDGHIAFNEPGSSLTSRTRVKTLTQETREDNSRFFGNNINKVPKTVLTVGVGTIMDAEEVLIMASGASKAQAIHDTIEEGVNHMCAASALQMHQHGIIVCDDAACSKLLPKTVDYFKQIENLKFEGV
ncbi:MAG: glucosamine-6-phosphate deaminase [Lactobacillaceae bacterium]|jgi:glucosamine-6-phosphate deaminase|nr:glucosamine-6-phosphate deaminase [Lactobacillaceae bacterium]